MCACCITTTIILTVVIYIYSEVSKCVVNLSALHLSHCHLGNVLVEKGVTFLWRAFVRLFCIIQLEIVELRLFHVVRRNTGQLVQLQ